MSRVGALCALIAVSVCFGTGVALADMGGAAAVAKMAATWNKINTYECTVTVHEANGTRVQDRVYLIRFARPTQTRVDIVKGDGRGSAAIWNGGDRVRGHQGGLLSIIRLNVDIHSKFATDLLGSTIDQANFGALLSHLKSLDPNVLHATVKGGNTVLVVELDPPKSDTDITKEVYIVGPDGLPVEYFQYAEDKVVRHVVNSGLKVNTDIPPSAWQL